MKKAVLFLSLSFNLIAEAYSIPSHIESRNFLSDIETGTTSSGFFNEKLHNPLKQKKSSDIDRFFSHFSSDESKLQSMKLWLKNDVHLSDKQTEIVMRNEEKNPLIFRLRKYIAEKNEKKVNRFKKKLKNRLSEIESGQSNFSEKDLEDINILKKILEYQTDNTASADIENDSFIEEKEETAVPKKFSLLRSVTDFTAFPFLLPFKILKKTTRMIGLFPSYSPSVSENIKNIPELVVKGKKTYKFLKKKKMTKFFTAYFGIPIAVFGTSALYNMYKHNQISFFANLSKHSVFDRIISQRLKNAFDVFRKTSSMVLATAANDIFHLLPDQMKCGRKDVFQYYRCLKNCIAKKMQAFNEILTIYVRRDVPLHCRVRKIEQKMLDLVLGDGFSKWVETGGPERDWGNKMIYKIAKKTLFPVIKAANEFLRWNWYASRRIVNFVLNKIFVDIPSKRPWLIKKKQSFWERFFEMFT